MYKTNGDVLKEYYNQNDVYTYPNDQNFKKKIEDFIKLKLDSIKFSFFFKNSIISLAALIISFFLDISSVPLMGNISIEVSKNLFPTWHPIDQSIKPISFWWIPVITYIIFVLFTYKTYKELRKGMRNSANTEVIDRIIGASVSVIDGIATALPLIGAAILLISIKLGPEIFIGLSIPFEIKALAILAIGKLYEPVLDEMGVEFQHISSNVNEMKNAHDLQIQIQSINSLGYGENIKNNNFRSFMQMYSQNEIDKLEFSLKKVSDYTGEILLNLKQSGEILNGMMNASLGTENRIFEVKELTAKIIEAADSLGDERTLLALRSLEAIINRDGSKQNGKEI